MLKQTEQWFQKRFFSNRVPWKVWDVLLGSSLAEWREKTHRSEIALNSTNIYSWNLVLIIVNQWLQKRTIIGPSHLLIFSLVAQILIQVIQYQIVFLLTLAGQYNVFLAFDIFKPKFEIQMQSSCRRRPHLVIQLVRQLGCALRKVPWNFYNITWADRCSRFDINNTHI